MRSARFIDSACFAKGGNYKAKACYQQGYDAIDSVSTT